MATSSLALLTALAILTGSSSAAPSIYNNYRSHVITPTLQQCALNCPSSSSKFNYEPGQTYVYSYESDVKTSSPDSEHSSLHVRASAHLQVISQCDMILKLEDVSVQDSDPRRYERREESQNNDQFKQSLERQGLMFSFIDGRVDSVCPSEGEESWALNIKKSILSTLQNSMGSFTGISDVVETDVTGKCPVKYQVTSSWGEIKIRKTKDMLACTDRSNTQSVYQTVAYNAPSGVQSVPLLSAEQNCEQEIDINKKILKSSSCMETHSFKPFSDDKSGAKTEISFKLTFSQQTTGTSLRGRVIGTERSSLLFDHSQATVQQQSSALQQAQQLLAQLCQQTSAGEVRPETPGNFAQLVRQLQELDTRSLRQIEQQSRAGPCPKAQEFIRDALPLISTPASVAVIKELVTHKHVTSTESDVLIASIAFVKNPTSEMLRELQGLLSAEYERSALAVSSAVHTYITKNKEQDSDVTSLIRVFVDELRHDCRTTTQSEITRVLLTLRSLGNIGLTTNTDALARCASNDRAPMSIRVTALQAYRRVPCTISRAEAMNLYENQKEDSELRINAYLNMMQCADNVTIGRVRTILEHEEVNQVGSFVWTHLTNLAQSSNPLKANVKAIVGDTKLLTRFDMDKRKYSRNVEFSAFSNLLNMGAGIDSNLIWSPNSFIPRSVNLNLTLNMFGESVNLFEAGTRTQGLEQLLEKYLGPQGFSDHRQKRSVRQSDISSIDSRFHKSRDPSEVSYFLRLFGNEIKSGDIYNVNFDPVKEKFNLDDILQKLARGNAVDYSRSFNLFDTTVQFATGSGLPLKMNAVATATVFITANGKFDIRSRPNNFEISGSLKPSAAVEVTGSMSVDGHVTETRLKVVNKLHSSTIFDGTMTLRDGKIFDLEWKMPQNKIEVFSAESRLYITHRGSEREQKSANVRSVEKSSCTSRDAGILSKMGFELCGELAYPTGRFLPVAGPAVAKIYLNKLDTFTSAKLEANYNKNAAACSMKVSFTMPGSRDDREMTIDFKMDKNDRKMSLDVRTPWKKASVTGEVTMTDSRKKVMARALVDERKEYTLDIQLDILNQSQQIKYTPSLRLVLPDRRPITLTGELTHITKRKVFGNLAIQNALSEPITFGGMIELQDRRRSKKFDANIQFSSGIVRGSLAGFLMLLRDPAGRLGYATRADVNYQLQRGSKQRVVVNHKFRDMSAASMSTYNFGGSWISTAAPRYNGNFDLDLQYSPNSLRTRLDAGFDNIRKITIIESGAFDFNSADKKFNGLIKIEVPFQRWNYEIKTDHVHNYDRLQSNVTVKHDNKEHSLDIGLRKDNSRYLSAIGEAELKIAGEQPMRIKNVLTERQPREYQNELSIYGKGQTIRSTSVYKMGQRHELTSDLQATGYDPITIKGHLNPSLRNMQARSEIRYGQKSYVGDMSWLHRGDRENFNTRASTELSYNSLVYGISGEMSKRSNDLSASLETKAGEYGKVSLSGSVTMDALNPKLEARAEWPQRQFVTIETKARVDSGLVRYSRGQFEGEVRLRSSVRGYEDMGGEMKGTVDRQNVNTHGEVNWARDQKIVLDLTYDPTKASLNIQTPFNDYRIIKADVTYMRRGYALNGNAQVQIGHHQISLSGQTNNQLRSDYYLTTNGNVNIRTSFNGYRHGRLSWSHSNDERSWKCEHELTFEGNKYKLNVDGEIDLRAKRSNGKAVVSWANDKSVVMELGLNVSPGEALVVKAKVTTPFRGYEAIGLDMNNRLDMRTNSYTLNNELSLGDPRYKIAVDGNLAFNSPSFTSGLRIVTPHPKFVRLVANLRNTRQSDGSWLLHADLDHAPGMSQPFNFDAKLGIDRMYGLEVTVSSPAEYLRSMTSKVTVTARSPKSFDVVAEVNHNKMRDKLGASFTLEAETIRSARLSLRVTSPFESFRGLQISGSHVYQTETKCLTSLAYRFNDIRGQLTHEQTIQSLNMFNGVTRFSYLESEGLITMDHNVNYDENTGRLMATAKITSPYSSAREVEVSINGNVGQDGQTARALAVITYNRQERITADYSHSLNFQPDGTGMLKYSLKLITPFRAFSLLEVDYDKTQAVRSGQLTMRETYVSKMDVNGGRYESSRLVDYNNGAAKINYKGKGPENQYEFNLDHTPTHNGVKDSVYWLANRQRYEGEYEHAIDRDHVTSSGSLRLANSEEYSFSANVQKRSSSDASAEISSRLGPHGTMTSSFKLAPSGTIEFLINAQTPYEGYERFDLRMNHEGSVNNFRTTASLQTSVRDYENFGATLTYRGVPNDFSTTLQVQTPIASVRSIGISLNNKYDDRRGLTCGASVEYSGKRIETTLTFKDEGRMSRVNLDVKTPFEGYTSFTIDADHAASSSKSFRTNVRMTSSVENWRTASASLELNALRVDDVTVNVGMTTARGEHGIKYRHLKRYNDVTASVEVTCPARGYERFTVSFDRKDNNGNPTNKIIVTTPIRDYETFELSTTKTGRLDGDMLCEIELKTTISHAQRTALHYTHNVRGESVQAKLQLDTSYPGYEKFAINLDHSKQQNSLRTSVTGESSVRGYERFSALVDYSQQYNGFKASANINTPFEDYRQLGFTLTHAGTAQQFETTVRLNSPLRSAPQIDFTLRHRGDSWKDFNCSLTSSYGGKQVGMSTGFKLVHLGYNNEHYDASAKIVTPYEILRNFELRAEHTRRDVVKSGKLDVVLNDDKKVDLDYSYKTEGDQNIVINMRDPYTLSTNVNMAGSQGSADIRSNNRNIRFDFGYKNIERAGLTEKALSFKTMLTNRVVGFDCGYSLSPTTFNNHGKLFWDSDTNPDLAYELIGSRTESRSETVYNGQAKFTCNHGNTDAQFVHKSQYGGHHVTDITIQSERRLHITSDLNTNDGFIHRITVQHPSLNGDASLVSEFKNGNSFTSTLTWERQTVILAGEFNNESRGNDVMKYNSKLRLSHPNSYTDVHLLGELSVTNEKAEMSIENRYQSIRDRQMKISTLKAEIDKIKRDIKAELTTPLQTIKVEGLKREADQSQGVYRYDFTASIGRHNYKTEFDMSRRDRSLGIKVFESNNDASYVQLFGQAYSPLSWQFDVSRVSRAGRQTDAHLSLAIKEEDDRILAGAATLRPQLFDEIQGYVAQQSRSPPLPIQDMVVAWNQFTRSWDDEISMRSRYLDQMLAPLKQGFAELKQRFNDRISEIQRIYNEMYYRNEFYIRDLHQSLQKMSFDMQRRLDGISEEISRCCQATREWISSTNQKIADKINEQTEALRNDMVNMINKLSPYFDNLARQIADRYQEHRENLLRQPWIRNLMALSPRDVFNAPQQIMGELKRAYESFLTKAEYYLMHTTSKPEFIRFKETVLQFIEKHAWLAEYLGMEGEVRGFVQRVRQMDWRTMKYLASQKLNEYLKLDKTKWTKFSPQTGEYQFEMYMPMDVPDVSILQKLDITDWLLETRDNMADYLPQSDWSLLDTIYAYKPKSDIREWVPPFKAHATLTGGQHFVTFDKKFYEFAGECSYLLARDFMDHSFSVIVNYDRPMYGKPVKKSLSVLIGARQFELMTDGHVTLDGARVELPLHIGGTTLTREGDMLNVHSDIGLDVSCDLKHDHCAISIAGWYYGKTAGLLGTYDNEPYNDWTTGDNTLATTTERFADSWTVGYRCRPTNHARVSPSNVQSESCEELFVNGNSVLKSCFRIVSPEPFLRMCINELSAKGEHCHAAAAYVHECKRQEVHIRMPNECVSCEVPSSNVKYTRSRTLSEDEIPSSADVVLVIQHAPCNSHVIDKVKDAIDNLDNALKAEDMNDNRYAVVGFGGRGNLYDPSVRTMDGQTFNSANKVITAFNRFDLEAGQSSDVMSAIKYAASLPFRAGASKTIVLVSCDTCSESEYRYSDIQRILLDNDIRLHVLSQLPILLKSRSPKTAYIFGVDEDAVYTSRDVGNAEIEGDTDLRRYVRLPKDLCVALAQDTEGSIFSAKQWVESRYALQKKFSDVWVRTIADKAEPSDCQVCECIANDNSLSGTSRCHSCEPRKPVYTLMPNFYGDDFIDNDRTISSTRPVQNNDESSTRRRQRTRGNRGNRRRNRQRRPRPIPSRPVVRDQ